MSYAPLNPRPDAKLKGIQGGNCNRTACQLPGANWYNKSTRAYYCPQCAKDINSYPPTRADCIAMYGPEHPNLCVYQPKI